MVAQCFCVCVCFPLSIFICDRAENVWAGRNLRGHFSQTAKSAFVYLIVGFTILNFIFQ